MGEYKPLGSEKLNGDDKLKRILELTYYKTNDKKSSSDTKPEIVKESKNGTYGIVKEKDGYYVKKGLNEQSLDYIGGLFMKNRNRYSSYAEALKRLELLKGQEDLQEATKYILKQNTPQQEPTPTPAPEEMPVPDATPDATPMGDMPSDAAPTGDIPADVPADDMSMGGETPSPEGGDETKPSDYMAEVQKFAGKLGQELRDQKEKMESDDIKYVLNMIISAVDLEKLDDEDLEDISKKFEPKEEVESDDEEMGGEETLPTGDEEVPAEEPAPEGADAELGETMDKLHAFINSKSPREETDEIDLSKFVDIGKGSVQEEDELKELDLDEIKRDINDSINNTLSKYFK
jgi:hypothetical protein